MRASSKASRPGGTLESRSRLSARALEIDLIWFWISAFTRHSAPGRHRMILPQALS